MKTSPSQLNEMLKEFVVGELGSRGAVGLVFLLGVSLLCAYIISALYLYFFGKKATGSHVYRAFPLLSVSITGIFISIQFSLPLSLGLLGALSIVRFRTPIKEPEEIGFIMLVVSVSIACATFNLLYAVVILGIAVVGLVIQKWGPNFLKGSLNDGLVLLTLPQSEYEKKGEKVLDYLNENLAQGQVESISKNGDKSIISYRFARLRNDKCLEIQRALKELVAGGDLSVFFNRQPTV